MSSVLQPPARFRPVVSLRPWLFVCISKPSAAPSSARPGSAHGEHFPCLCKVTEQHIARAYRGAGGEWGGGGGIRLTAVRPSCDLQRQQRGTPRQATPRRHLILSAPAWRGERNIVSPLTRSRPIGCASIATGCQFRFLGYKSEATLSCRRHIQMRRGGA